MYTEEEASVFSVSILQGSDTGHPATYRHTIKNHCVLLGDIAMAITLKH